ncbi:MAG TPA: flavodoxin domain-containing protein [Phototrophicaceae bacterium]|nr:flavodoxin domain-containing protein [Phototrophicaceae bacterium]
MNVLVGYASAHGSTAEVAEYIGKSLHQQGFKVTVANVEKVHSVDAYHLVVLGTAIHSGSWLPEMTKFINDFQESLMQRPVYFWVNCIRVLEPHGLEHVMEYYMDTDLLEKMNVQDITAFGGKLDLQTVDWNERWTLAARYDGATWPSSFDGDFRDWDKMRQWCGQITKNLTAFK